MRTLITTLAGVTLLCLTGCATHRRATPVAAAPAPVTTLGAGDALGVELHRHYVMVATLNGETRPVAITRK